VISEEGRGKEKNKIEKDEEEKFEVMRRHLVNNLGGYLLLDEKVRKAMLRVPRHRFVPEYEQKAAYMDRPLDIGHGQTISAPHMVAIMCELLELSEGHKVLEIGTGSGYNAAVMGELVGESGHVYTVERIDALANFARENLRKIGYKNVTVVLDDGSTGYS
jgi:protein-L-isoaspartate(D-aspartate) O-methyltransferase